MSKQSRNLTHTAAPKRPTTSLDELMGLSSPALPEPDPSEPTRATEDPETPPPPRQQGRSHPPAREPQPYEPPPEADPYVLYTVQIKRSTYIRLKQAEYYTPGFEQRKLVDKAVNAELDENKYSDRQMPPEEQAKLLNSKKLKG
jgi:hypothetical protein